MTILVTGARGHIGGVVLTELVAAGVQVRAASRNPSSDDQLPPDVEVVRADLNDPTTFPNLLAGVDRVFLYAHAAHAPEFAAEAARAGVDQVVLLSSNSVLFPDAASNPTAVEHMTVESALRDSGMAWTFIRPGYLATNTFRWQTSIRDRRTVRTAFPDTGGTPLVHERDVAEVAVQTLLDDRHRNTAHLVLGGTSLTEREQVETISDALGEPVDIDVLDVDAYRHELLAVLPEVFVEPVIAAAGEVPQVPSALRVDAVPAVLGRSPLTFARWARDHAADFR